MTPLFTNAEIDIFTRALERLEHDAEYRDLAIRDFAAAIEQVGLQLPSKEIVRQSLVDAGLSAEDLELFDTATPEQVAQAMEQRPAFDPGLAVGELSSKFYRGVPGYQAAALWWGFQLPFSHQDADDIFKVGQAVAGLVSTLGGFIANAVPAIKPFVLALMLYVVAQTIVIGAVKTGCQRNQSKGIWISMAWVGPGVFVPTCL